MGQNRADLRSVLKTHVSGASDYVCLNYIILCHVASVFEYATNLIIEMSSNSGVEEFSNKNSFRKNSYHLFRCYHVTKQKMHTQ
jgi:hypothetical protein